MSRHINSWLNVLQVRGKKNLVIEKSLAGPIGVFVKFSTLQEYGVDKVFFLENDNVDTSQRNVIFLARGEKATQPMAIAGTSAKGIILFPSLHHFESFWLYLLDYLSYNSSN